MKWSSCILIEYFYNIHTTVMNMLWMLWIYGKLSPSFVHWNSFFLKMSIWTYSLSIRPSSFLACFTSFFYIFLLFIQCSIFWTIQRNFEKKLFFNVLRTYTYMYASLYTLVFFSSLKKTIIKVDCMLFCYFISILFIYKHYSIIFNGWINSFFKIKYFFQIVYIVVYIYIVWRRMTCR